jgi:hypothetical protein
MGKKHTSNNTSKLKTDWDQFCDLTDEQVRTGIEDDPDAHRTDEDFWKKAEVVMRQPRKP